MAGFPELERAPEEDIKRVDFTPPYPLDKKRTRIFLPSTDSKENDGLPPQLEESAMDELAKQGYKIVGTHSVVKTCGWTHKSIKGQGTCYKQRFYGIKTHRCLQMSSSLSCANRCTFCWRDYKAPVSREWSWKQEDEKEIVKASLFAQKLLLSGHKGDDSLNKKIVLESFNPKHVALSLTGEPINYPKFSKLLDLFHKKGISTFVVTKGQYPELIERLRLVTQLYISLDGADPETLKKTTNPIYPDYWERFNQSLEAMAKKNFRTAIRVTVVKGVNDKNPEGYAKLIEKTKPDFVEVKSYMHVGASMQRLDRSAMAGFPHTKKFAEEILAHLPDYFYYDDQEESMVSCLARREIKGKEMIDFPSFFQKAKMVSNSNG
jgi:tRNA wybutosine-synthesizing protein 1